LSVDRVMPGKSMAQPTDRRLVLPTVTLVAVSDVALAATARALAVSQHGLQVVETLLLTSREPPPGVRALVRKIAPIDSRDAYSRFMIHELHRHISTSHALCVQWDGYVLDPLEWEPEFLEYDYIGPPWPHFADGMNVGNGGFSLRSRRLLEACTTLPISTDAEDVLICRTHRQMLEDRFGLTAPSTWSVACPRANWPTCWRISNLDCSIAASIARCCGRRCVAGTCAWRGLSGSGCGIPRRDSADCVKD
jgi:hypothetical protein